MRLRVVPLAPPREEVLKEKAEHPWLTMQQAERVAREHAEETARKVKAIREKRERGEELSSEELKVIYGERVVSEELRREQERAELPWDAAGRRAEEARKKYDERKS